MAKKPRSEDLASAVTDLDLGMSSRSSSIVEKFCSGSELGDVGELQQENIFSGLIVSSFLF